MKGGVGTDCFETTAPLRACPGTWDLPDWRNPDEWIAHSARIAAVTGLTPPPPRLGKTTR
ncbi:hypothetical protein [Caulobacter sp. 17J65-9]|uniref:hypothetical protein n=1 Tax=Caulobacter sp. 17J65-9 TaxID=2709382 RepID=UPI0013CBD05B|nr:hypothetical protein [Caulobacter sp. 17J65-9]NEX91904.1 hypothetical protein [Caulobacter sp. 17J65-9]